MKELEDLKKEETKRILEVLEGLGEVEKAIYLNAYGDALEYAYDFNKIIKERGVRLEISEYLP